MIKSDLATIKSAHSLYVTFNPELASRNDEVWYSVIDGKVKEISADFQNNSRDFSLPYEKNMEYFSSRRERITECGSLLIMMKI